MKNVSHRSYECAYCGGWHLTKQEERRIGNEITMREEFKKFMEEE